MGDYILSSGEVASFTFLDSILRLLPGVLGNEASIEDKGPFPTIYLNILNTLNHKNIKILRFQMYYYLAIMKK